MKNSFEPIYNEEYYTHLKTKIHNLKNDKEILTQQNTRLLESNWQLVNMINRLTKTNTTNI